MKKAILFIIAFVLVINGIQAAVNDPHQCYNVDTADITGSSLLDHVSPNTRNLTLNLGTQITGLINEARNSTSEGSDFYMRQTANVDFDDADSSFSIQLFFYIDSYGTGTRSIFYGNDAGTDNFEFKYDGTNFVGYTRNGGGECTSMIPQILDKWVMVTAVYDTTANVMSWYINETFLCNESSVDPVPAITDLCIGNDKDCAGNSGRIAFDNIRIYKHTITAAEISELYNTGIGRECSYAGTTPTYDTLNMSIPYPSNSTEYNTATLNFNTSVNSTSSPTFNCSLYINDTLNMTSPNYASGLNKLVNFTLPFSSTEENSYTYFMNCTNSNVSEKKPTSPYIFYIDRVSPSYSTNLDGNNSNFTLWQDLTINITETFLYSILINDSCGHNIYNISPEHDSIYKFNITGCSTGIQYTNITVCDGPNGTALNCINQNYRWNNQARLRIGAIDYYGAPITNLTLFYVNGTLKGSSTTGFLNITLPYGYYNISVDPAGYITANKSLTLSSNFQEYNFTLYTTNSITFNFKDEITLSTIENVSIELISIPYSGNFSTQNGTLYLDLLTPAEYSMRYWATDGGYYERFYYFNLVNRTHTNLTLYLISNASSEVTATVYDQGNHLLEDVYIKVLRYDVTTNSYNIREIAKTNFEGETKLHVTLNDEFYKFILEYPLGTVKKITSPTYIYETTLNFQITLGQDIAENFYNSQDVTYSLVFNDATNNFRYTYSDANNIVSQGCLKIYRITDFQTILYNSSCVSGAASSILLGVDNTSGYKYEAKAYIYFDTVEYYLNSLTKIFEITNIGGMMGLFMIAILMIVFAFTGYWHKAIPLILVPLPL